MHEVLMPSGRGYAARRPGPRRRFKSVQITFPPDMIPTLDEAATERGYDNRSELVRAACAAFLEDKGECSHVTK